MEEGLNAGSRRLRNISSGTKFKLRSNCYRACMLLQMVRDVKHCPLTSAGTEIRREPIALSTGDTTATYCIVSRYQYWLHCFKKLPSQTSRLMQHVYGTVEPCKSICRPLRVRLPTGTPPTSSHHLGRRQSRSGWKRTHLPSTTEASSWANRQ